MLNQTGQSKDVVVGSVWLYAPNNNLVKVNNSINDEVDYVCIVAYREIMTGEWCVHSCSIGHFIDYFEELDEIDIGLFLLKVM